MNSLVAQHPVLFQGLVLRAFDDSDAAAFACAAQESIATVGWWMSWCTAAFAEPDALAWFAQCRQDLAA